MGSRQTQTSCCYLLHSRPYQDNDLLIQCLSRDDGIINLLSKGARSSKKGLLSLLQPFQCLSVSYVGSGDLYILTGVEIFSLEQFSASNSIEFSKLKLCGKSIYCAYYINELILRLLPLGDPFPEVFRLYQKTLVDLKQDNNAVEIVLRIFEISLLTLLGYEPNLQVDIHSGKKIEQDKQYYYDPLSGPYELDHNMTMCNVNQQHPCISGKTLTAINSLTFDNSQVQKESKILLRQVLLCYLGDKPLKSREVYRQLYG
jgi:DNA repair protein RecO (recombination protein O)